MSRTRFAQAGRPRVLVIGPVPPPYHGVAVMTRTLLDSGVTERFEVLHLDTSDRRDVSNIGRLDFGNVQLALVHGTHFMRLLARGRMDVVYAPLSQNTLGFLRDSLFLLPALAAGLPVVLHLHGGRYDEFVRSAPFPVRGLARWIFSRATRIVVLGETLRGMLSGLAGDGQISVVPNGVADTSLVSRDTSGGGRMRIIFVGNLIPSKGYAELLDAVQTLLDEGMDVAVTFAGAVVDAAIHERALAGVRYGNDRIRFTGSVDAAVRSELLAASDVLALPSHYGNEAHPLVLLEAMAAGLPVVSTHHAAIPEIVVDGTTGLLVEPRDTGGLAAALRRLAQRPDERLAMGRAARRRYEERFTLSRWTERMTAVFESVLPAVR